MENLTKYWHLKDFSLFEKLGKHKLFELSNQLEMINVKKGEELLLSRTNQQVVYFIKSGTIKVISTDKGHTITVLKAGNIFGELSMFESDENDALSEKALALENGVVCVIEHEQMKSILERNSSLKNQLLKHNGIRIRKLQRSLEDLLYKDSETRIKEYIFNFINEFGKREKNRLVASNLLSQNDIAHLTNTSRQTVSNVMSKLRKEKIIDYNSNEISIDSLPTK